MSLNSVQKRNLPTKNCWAAVDHVRPPYFTQHIFLRSGATGTSEHYCEEMPRDTKTRRETTTATQPNFTARVHTAEQTNFTLKELQIEAFCHLPHSHCVNSGRLPFLVQLT